MALGALLVLVVAGVTLTWVRLNVVPPDCGNAATLALVRQALTERFSLPATVSIDNIETHSGGYFAFRFACEATLHGIDPNDLQAGTPIPGKVYYISRLTDGGRRHEVSVRIFPLLKLEKVQ